MAIKSFNHIRHMEPLAARLTNLYRQVFGEIDELAIQRHMLTHIELRDVWQNPRLQKRVAFDERDEPVGVAVITNSLGDWPLVSTRYFARHFPDLYAGRKIWYVGFVGVKPGHSGVFPELIDSMSTQVIDGRGMAVMDFAHYNVTVRHLDQVTHRILTRIDQRATCQELDSQRFFAWTFPTTDRPNTSESAVTQ